MSGRRWTQAEIDLLEDRWGSGTMDGLAKKIGRTKVAVRTMGHKLGLGAWSEASEYLSAQTLASAMGISERIVHDWIRIDGMPCVKRKKAKYVYYDIRLDQFWRWMEDKQHLFDSRRIEPLILGEEPPWMAAKRRQDRINRREEAVSLDALVKHSGRHWQTVKKAIMTSGVPYFYFGRHKALYVSSDAAEQVLRQLG
jgi:hypothetical protein